ncbi:hypothetical protein Q5O24_15300 [Eubacteriaceae bacterium ES3]|nr:hypothetical protein Q5O24_15300 [Eubacteriaceae bacterium ES3]
MCDIGGEKMYEDQIKRLNILKKDLDKKVVVKLEVEPMVGLMSLLENGLEPLNPKEDSAVSEVQQLVAEVEEMLEAVIEGGLDKASIRAYQKAYKAMTVDIKKIYGIEPAGAIVSQYLAVGLSIGTGLGVALLSVNPAFISLGIGIGLSLGVALGSAKEKEAKKSGKMY